MHWNLRASPILRREKTHLPEASSKPEGIESAGRGGLAGIVAESISEWSRHNDSRLGASLAFYTLFSLTPLLLVALAIGGLVTTKASVEIELTEGVRRLIGPQGAAAVQMILAGAHNPKSGIIVSILGMAALLFGASSVMLDLKQSLNTIWEVKLPETTGLQTVFQILKDRLFSFALVAGAGSLVLVSLFVNAFLGAAGQFAAQVLPAPATLLHWADAGTTFVFTALLFAAIYKVVPDTDLGWTDVMLGSSITAVLFTLGKLLIGIYLDKAAFHSSYGAAASLVVLIIWVYYSSQIFFFGAELTRSYAQRHGRHR